MRPETVSVALRPNIGIVAVGHSQVFWKAINSLCVLVPRMHEGKAVVTRCTDQAVDVTLKHTVHTDITQTGGKNPS